MKTKSLVLDALLAAILLASQISLAWIPNVELVSLLLILYTMVFGGQVWLILFTFIMLEGLVYGFGLWWISYLYAWPILCLAAARIRSDTGPLAPALVSCLFGLSFGFLCALSYFFTGGPGAAYAWWISGIPFDFIHGIGNFIIAFTLFTPLYRLLLKLKERSGGADV